MKSLWIFVVIALLLLVPLTPRNPEQRVVTTLSSGVVVRSPSSSLYGLRDLETLLAGESWVREVHIQYGWRRGVVRVFPDTAVITLTAPWVWEKLRYPWLNVVRKNLEDQFFVPLDGSPDIYIKSVHAWVSIDEHSCVVDQLVTVANATEEALDSITLSLPQLPWVVRTQIGEALDHISADDGLHILLSQALEPKASLLLLLSLESNLVSHAGFALAEVVILQPQGLEVKVNLKDQQGIRPFALQHSVHGYWSLYIPATSY